MPQPSLPILLLVDDDFQVLEALNILFSDHYRTLLASSGAQAIDLVMAHHDVNAVVLDIKMANMSGLDTFRAIRRLAPCLPIIIHTGELRERTVRLVESLQPFACLQKGKSITDLVRVVHEACQRSAEQTPSAPNPDNPGTTS